VITADQLAELVKDPGESSLDDSPAPEAPATATAETTAPAAGTRSNGGRRSAGGRAPSSPVSTAPPAAKADVPAVATESTQHPASTIARRAVVRVVRSADRPLKGGEVANAAQKADPELLASDWQSTGGFFAWLSEAVPEVRWATKPAPGFVWDPKRFSETDLPSVETVALPPLQRQVVDVTEIPNLPADHYRTLLDTLAKDVKATPFVRPETARRVRDACQAKGAKVGRASVNTVISGILYAGLDLAAKPSAKVLAETWADNVVGLCRGARMDLRPQDVVAIRTWVTGGLLTT
jgi:hypothetical protein